MRPCPPWHGFGIRLFRNQTTNLMLLTALAMVMLAVAAYGFFYKSIDFFENLIKP